MSNKREWKMKRFKVREVIKLLEADGWYIKAQRGSHRQYAHPMKRTKVTVNKGMNDDLTQFELNSIWKQAGWK